MKKFLLPLFLVFSLSLATPALSQTIDCQSLDISSMTPVQIESAKSFCATKPTVPIETVTPEKVREWGSLGKEFSSAVIETSKGLGVAVNEFLFTPVGFLLAFYFMWDMIGGILVGIPLLIFVWILYFKGLEACQEYTYEYENVPVLWGAFTVKMVKSKVPYRNVDLSAYLSFASLIAIALSGLIIGILIF